MSKTKDVMQNNKIMEAWRTEAYEIIMDFIEIFYESAK
jgi:hypothetical protein